MHDMQRIAALDDVDARECTPCTANGVKISSGACFQLRQSGNGVRDDLLGFLQRLLRRILQRKATERKREPLTNAMSANIDQLERTAAQITDNAIGLVDTRRHAERGQLRFTSAGQNFNRDNHKGARPSR